jgi:hypothetical protein
MRVLSLLSGTNFIDFYSFPPKNFFFSKIHLCTLSFSRDRDRSIHIEGVREWVYHQMNPKTVGLTFS